MLPFYTLIIEEDNDKVKFEKLYTLYRKKMWYAANSVLSDSYLAEDAVHNAFIGIAKNINKMPDVESSRTLSYVITAVKNAAIDILRKNKGISETDIDELFDLSDTKNSEFYHNLETEDLIIKILRGMPEIYRDVLYLLVVEEMSEKEIAKLLGRKIGTVHQQVRRGRAILKEELMKGACIYGNQ